MTYMKIAVGGMSLLGGISSSRSAKKSAKEQLKLQREMFDFAKKRYDDYKTNYGEIEQTLIKGAKEGVQADLGGVTSRAAADVATQFAGAEEARIRNMQRMGINPNSGRAESMARQSGLSEALASAGNITANRENERRTADAQTYMRRQNAMNMGLGQLGVATGDMNNAMAGMANTYGQMSTNAANQAGQMFGVAGYLGGQALQGLGNRPPATVNPGAVIKKGVNYTDNPYPQQPYQAMA